MKYRVYTDGSYRRRVGITAAYRIIKDDTGEVIIQDSIFEPGDFKDEIYIDKAELWAISLALKSLSDLKLLHENIMLYNDGKRMVNLVNSRKSLPFYSREIYHYLYKATNLRVVWISRNYNEESHDLCHDALQEKTREKKLMQVKIIHQDGSIYLAKAHKYPSVYTVDLENMSCTCYMFQNKNKHCKHLQAAVLKAPLIESELVHDEIANIE